MQERSWICLRLASSINTISSDIYHWPLCHPDVCWLLVIQLLFTWLAFLPGTVWFMIVKHPH